MTYYQSQLTSINKGEHIILKDNKGKICNACTTGDEYK